MYRIISLAAGVRKRARQTKPAFSTHRLVKACFPDAIVTGRDLPDGMHGMATITPDGPIIVYQRSMPVLDQRFAIAHEIGHLLMDRAQLVSGGGIVRSRDRERRADRFARELLVPLEELRRHVRRWPARRGLARHDYLDHVDEIASFFGAPAQVVSRQIRALASLAKRCA